MNCMKALCIFFPCLIYSLVIGEIRGYSCSGSKLRTCNRAGRSKCTSIVDLQALGSARCAVAVCDEGGFMYLQKGLTCECSEAEQVSAIPFNECYKIEEKEDAKESESEKSKSESEKSSAIKSLGWGLYENDWLIMRCVYLNGKFKWLPQ